jgi:hypothetical protein
LFNKKEPTISNYYSLLPAYFKEFSYVDRVAKHIRSKNIFCILNDCDMGDNSKAEQKLDIILDFKIDSFFKLNYCEFDFGEIFLAYPVMNLEQEKKMLLLEILKFKRHVYFHDLSV